MLLASFVTLHPVQAQVERPSRVTLRGHTLSVFDSTSAGAIELRLLRGDTVVVATSSDPYGWFELPDVPHGTYVLRTSGGGLEAAERALTVSDTSFAFLRIYAGRIVPDDELLFGAPEARRDIAAGRVRFLSYGIPVIGVHFYVPEFCEARVALLYTRSIRKLERKYGYGHRDVTQPYTKADEFLVVASVASYNEAVHQHLTERNGPGWVDRFGREERQAWKVSRVVGCAP